MELTVMDKIKIKVIRSLTSTLSQPAQWMTDIFTGGATSFSGVTVSERKAMTLTAVWQAISILAGTEATLPLHLYKKIKPKGKDLAEEHPLYQVLHDIANPEMTSYQWREVSATHGLLWGNEYSYIQRKYDSPESPVIALWPLPPDRMLVQRNAKNQLEYLYTSDVGGIIKYEPWEMLHTPGLGFDGLIGYSPIRMAKEAIGLGLATEQYGNSFFKNGASTTGVLEHPGTLQPGGAEKIRANFTSTYSGLTNAHKVAVLEEGMKYTQMSIPPEEAQFLETRKFQISEVARIYGLPPHMLGDLDRATYSNIEHQGLEFVTHSLRRRLRRKEQMYNMKCLTAKERLVYYTEYDVSELLRGDMLSRYRAHAISRQWGWHSANDIRQLEGENPIEDGDEYLSPMNMIPAAQIGIDPAEGGEDDEKGNKNPPVNPGSAK